MIKTPPVLCPACGTPMTLTRVTPGVAGHPELRTFACSNCHEVLTLAGDDRPPAWHEAQPSSVD